MASRAQMAEFLAKAKRLSNFTTRSLAAKLSKPPATIGDWVNLKHLPRLSERSNFVELLRTVGIDDVDAWWKAIDRIRSHPDDNPYRGLDPYGPDDDDLYFGRDRERESLRELIKSRMAMSGPPIVVLGPSGAGKTSLVSVVVGNLSSTIGITAISVTADDLIAGRIDSEPSQNRLEDTILFIDQCERLFTDDNSLAEHLTQLVEFTNRAKVTVLALRSDFYDRAADTVPFADSLQGQHVYVGHLTTEAATEIITRPAERAKLQVESSLLTRLITDLTTQTHGQARVEVLPLLSHQLHQLALHSDGTLRLNDYLRLGGLEGAVKVSAEQALAALIPAEQALVPRLFSHLFTASQDGAATRVTAELAQLEGAVGPDEADRILNEFLNARILTTSEAGITLAHESVLTSWDRLSQWVAEERATLVSISRIRNAADSWEQSGKDEGALLRGVRLEEATAITASERYSSHFTTSEQLFIDGSRSAAERRQRQSERRSRVLRTITAFAVVAAILTAVFGTFALRAETQARAVANAAESRQLATLANNLDKSPVMGAQFAIAGHEQAATVESRSAIIAAGAAIPHTRFTGNPVATTHVVSPDDQTIFYSDSQESLVYILGRADGQWTRRGEIQVPDIEVYALAISGDGQALYAGGVGGIVEYWDISSQTAPTYVGTLEGHTFSQPIQSMTVVDNVLWVSGTGPGIARWDLTDPLSPEALPVVAEEMSVFAIDSHGPLLAIGREDGSIRLVNTETGEDLSTFEAEVSTITSSVEFSPDGNLLAAGFRSNFISVWDISDPTQPTEVTIADQPFTTWVNSVAFSPDGSRLAASSSDARTHVWRTDSWTPAGPTLENPTNALHTEFVDKSTLSVSVADGSLRLWDLSAPGFTHLERSVWSIEKSPDASVLAASSSRRVQLWETNGDKITRTINAPIIGAEEPSGFASSSVSALSSDGQRLILGKRDGGAVETAINEILDSGIVTAGRTYSPGSGLAEQVDISPNGRWVAAVDPEGWMRIWDSSNDLPAPAFEVDLNTLGLTVRFSDDGETVVTTSDSGEVVLAQLIDGEWIERSRFSAHDTSAYSSALSPTQPILAVGIDNGTVIFYDISDITAPVEMDVKFRGTENRVYALAFNHDGTRLAASSTRGVTVWDISEPTEPDVVIQLSTSAVYYALTFSPDGSYLYGGGSNASPKFWDLDVDRNIERLCAVAGEAITLTEWQRFAFEIEFEPPCES